VGHADLPYVPMSVDPCRPAGPYPICTGTFRTRRSCAAAAEYHDLGWGRSDVDEPADHLQINRVVARWLRGGRRQGPTRSAGSARSGVPPGISLGQRGQYHGVREMRVWQHRSALNVEHHQTVAKVASSRRFKMSVVVPAALVPWKALFHVAMSRSHASTNLTHCSGVIGSTGST
jgi:hypothetical protein